MTTMHRNAQALAVGFMGFLVVAAVLLGPIRRTPAPGSYAVEDGLTRPVLISPGLLASFLQRRDRELIVVDLRAPDSYETSRLPGAVNASPAELVGTAGDTLLGPPGDQEVVLYAGDMLDPIDAAVELTRLGYRHVHVLEGGLSGFQREILTPPSLRGILSEEAAKREAPLFASRRNFFLEGGFAAPGAAQDPESLEAPALVSTRWLEDRGDRVVPVDTRSAEEYAAGHVPGAVHLPQTELRSSREGVSEMLLDRAALVSMIGQRGIGPDDEVIVYGADLRDATLGALALLRVGHRGVGVLEGTWGDWIAEGRPVATDSIPRRPTEYAATSELDDFEVGTSAVAKASKEGSAVIIDVRTSEEYRGESNAVEGRAGHIPGAVHRDFALDLAGGADGGRFRAPRELVAEYAKLGADPSRELIIYCQSGYRASQTFFLLRYVLGYERVRWYDGSWKAWGASAELPVKTGDEAS